MIGSVKKCVSDGAGPGWQTSLICSLSEQQELHVPPGCSQSHHEGPGSGKAPAYQTGKSLLKHIHSNGWVREFVKCNSADGEKHTVTHI